MTFHEYWQMRQQVKLWEFHHIFPWVVLLIVILALYAAWDWRKTWPPRK